MAADLFRTLKIDSDIASVTCPSSTSKFTSADRLYAEPRLAEVYDALDPDRSDLDAYVVLLDEIRVESVIDVGCGTGTFAIMLASRGIDVIGIDPAEASLDVARSKPGADAVQWVLGDAAAPLAARADAVTMTGNVAQVFLTDGDWIAALRSAFTMLRPGGFLILESRDPRAEAWRGWTRDATYRQASLHDGGTVACWEDVTDVDLPLVTFRTTFEFRPDNIALKSESTLRFRDRDEIATSLADVGFAEPEIRDAPDRPRRELVFIAERRSG